MISKQSLTLPRPRRQAHYLSVPVAVSATHVHLTSAAIAALFCDHYQLHEYSRLAQPNLYEAYETVRLIGPRGHLDHVRVIGPPVPVNQVEISSTDALTLGIDPPIRRSGDLRETPGISIKGPRSTLRVERGVIRPLRHVHMSPADSVRIGVKDGDSLEAVAHRAPGLLRDVLARVSPEYRLEFHIDADEANALNLHAGDHVEFRKRACHRNHPNY
jgi:propanediol utilization protein